MHALDKTLRNKLERTVMEARDQAEAAARAAIEPLGVGEAKPYAQLGDDEKELRRKLRVHGRQLGDARHAKKDTQEIERLVEEIAYEHWHRMLFARFLAENNLLMYPDPANPVAVSLAECEELASEEGATNGWELASRFAARMLPQIFRPESPVFQLRLPAEHEQKLERLLAELPDEVFHASDSLGWVYQFWQSKRKDAVNASELKIGARELPAVTQLFTEPYMVAFLLDNSLGAWWAKRRLTESDLTNAGSEEELRAKASLPGLPLDYLRFVKDEEGTWTLAAGGFELWPDKASELKILDPCCGSGHFLVAAFLMLVPMRMELEGLSARDAADRVLAENIHGLEIDPRCVELAAFALALAAWRLAGYRALPKLELACTGLAVGGSREEWMGILAGQPIVRNLSFYFGQLYDLFIKAPILGSLINPHRFLGSGLLDDQGMEGLQRALASAMSYESKNLTDKSEMGVTAQGVAKAAALLAGRYTLVATNVPYLGRGKQDDVLKEHLEKQYPLGKADLATAFVLRCLEFCDKGGSTGLVTPQNWLFLTTYTKLRQLLLVNKAWNVVARLGPGAFETISGEVVNVALPIITANFPAENQTMAGIDVSMVKGSEEKAAKMRGEKTAEIVVMKQDEQLKNPDAAIDFSATSSKMRLGKYAIAIQGIGTGDLPRYLKYFWEINSVTSDWQYFQTTPSSSGFNGFTGIIFWQDGKGPLAQIGTARKGLQLVGKLGLAVSVTGALDWAYFLGTRFDCTIGAIIPNDPLHLPALVAFASDPSYSSSVRSVDQALSVTEANFLKVPFDLPYWQKIAAEKYPNGLPEPESDDPTQWLFHGRPEHSTAALQVAVARLLGYRWPAETDEKMRLSTRARDLVARCDELVPFADRDGIVCIPPLRGEASASDRLLNLLATAYGSDWNGDVLRSLLKNADFADKGLDSWLRDGFFAQHCELFHQRPFVWHIWDGLRDGFAALVDYHRLDRKNLSTLIYTYLGDWIKRQKDEIATGVDGAEERLAAAETLKKRLELILEGEAPYDLFVRWKSIDNQPIGWEPDLNDGVRLNIRPFLSVPDVKKKGAGVLRDRPKITWDKDRGKEPKRPMREYPWFWGWDESLDFAGGQAFTGDRFNDCHLSLDMKRAARNAKEIRP